ncbi:hypothetical protein QJQ45_014796, partial [Haematococcus lacustris]
ASLISSPRVADAMRAVDRGLFVASEAQAAYRVSAQAALSPEAREAASGRLDAPQPIGFGVTISAPHMHASCLELLEQQLRPGARALDVGSGSGYLTAAMAYMTCVAGGAGQAAQGRDGQLGKGAEGRVVGVEHVPELVQLSRQAVQRLPWAAHLLEQQQLVLTADDGRLGWPSAAPYDAIHVGAASPKVPPALVEQLAPGGRLVIPLGPEGGPQQLVVVDKDQAGRVSKPQAAMGVMYVPLTTLNHQLGRSVAGVT